MIDSYFFIPGDKPKYLENVDKLKTDFIVIDLEDAVSTENKQLANQIALELEVKKNMFVRIPFFEKCYTNQQIKELTQKFAGQIVLPKISSTADINKVISMCHGLQLNMIVLIENARICIALEEILAKFSNQIHAIGFGSHDFCSTIGIKHTLQHLEHYKRQLILYSKAYDVKFIDGVDLDLKNFDQFKKECVFAFESGADGKFIIHPSQLNELNKIDFISEKELLHLKLVYDRIKDIPDQQIDVYTIEGKVYEKPHILRLKYLMKKLGNKIKN